ncbi:MAG TPA: Rne/Rng family ribonuclease [Candidatus Bathyarchaeia archaeon]|nr:Rne/Rng family ribonuclease [Candidatus Bathyarchaeia archaeon]
MAKRIVVNAGVTETRLAVQDGNLLTELYIERADRRSIVGNIYKGVVTNVLPGMQAAFVDIGLSKDAFLYAGDYTANLGESDRPGDVEDETADVDVGDGEAEPRREAVAPIEEMLRKGQEVLVQVAKESLGTKGARVTSFVSIPGRYIVYMPQAHHVGVSRRIHDDAERDRLRAIVKDLPPPPGGFIVRTVAEGKGQEELAADVHFLTRLWGQVQARFESAKAPALLHEEMDVTFRVVRDLFSPEIDEFLVDSDAAYQKCLQFATSLVPQLASRVRKWDKDTPIFEATGIEREIDKALRRRVWLKSGGYIVIDHTEALVAIDVNSGKYVGKRDFEETVLKINMEAVTEVVRQIRLRDLGGIIIIDFIDMERPEHRDQVFKALKRVLADDKARTNVLEISELGLVEMTRKRVRQSLQSLFCAPCPTCKGSGVVKSDFTLTAEIFRKIQAQAAGNGEGNGHEVVIRVHPEMARHLEADQRDGLERLQALIGRKVSVQAVPSSHREQYELSFR